MSSTTFRMPGAWPYVSLSTEDAVEARRRGDHLFTQYTTGGVRVEWRPDNPEAFRQNMIRSQYAEVAVARLLGVEPTDVFNATFRQPDIAPDIEVRATSWSLVGLLKNAKYAIDIPPSCLAFYDGKDRGRESRRFVLAAVGSPAQIKVLGYAYGRDILLRGTAFTKGRYLDVRQLRDFREIAEEYGVDLDSLPSRFPGEAEITIEEEEVE